MRKSGRLRVGVSENSPWIVLGSNGVQGIESRIVELWAGSMGVEPTYRDDAEANIFELLRYGEIDVVAAGLTSKTRFRRDSALSVTYLSSMLDGAHKSGRQPNAVDRVLAVAKGESALLLALDQFLIANRQKWRELAAATET